MNQLQQAMCDGAAMAYRDCAEMLRKMIATAPIELEEFVRLLTPLAEANEAKAINVYKEAERYAAHLNGESKPQ